MKQSARKKKPLPLSLVPLLNAFQATGRIATIYPFKGQISLNGGPGKPYEEIIRYLQDWKNSQ
jgi:hypothetical protein